jgi:hypothetical protein
MGTRKTKIDYLKDELRRKRHSCATAISDLEQEISKLYMNSLNAGTNEEKLQKTKNYLGEIQRRHKGNTRKSQEVEHKAEINLLRNKLKNQGKKDADIKKEVNKFKNELQASTRKAIPGKFTRRLEQHVLSKLPQISSNSSKLYRDGKPIGEEIQKVLGSTPLDMKKLDDAKSKVDELVKILSMKPGVFAKALSSRERSELQGVVDAYSIKVRELKTPSNLNTVNKELNKDSLTLEELKKIFIKIQALDSKTNNKEKIQNLKDKILNLFGNLLEKLEDNYKKSKSDEDAEKLIDSIRYFKYLIRRQTPDNSRKKTAYMNDLRIIKSDTNLKNFVQKYKDDFKDVGILPYNQDARGEYLQNLIENHKEAELIEALQELKTRASAAGATARNKGEYEDIINIIKGDYRDFIDRKTTVMFPELNE